MQITIELLNDHALHLLRDLEKMSIIRVINMDEMPVNIAPVIGKSRFAGRISKATVENLHQQLHQMRTT
jgi:hypothetical protein